MKDPFYIFTKEENNKIKVEIFDSSVVVTYWENDHRPKKYFFEIKNGKLSLKKLMESRPRYKDELERDWIFE